MDFGVQDFLGQWRCLEKNNVGKGDTVDGRNPANQLIGSLSHCLQGFIYIPGGAGFLPSTVWRERCYIYCKLDFRFLLGNTLIETDPYPTWGNGKVIDSKVPSSRGLCYFPGKYPQEFLL